MQTQTHYFRMIPEYHAVFAGMHKSRGRFVCQLIKYALQITRKQIYGKKVTAVQGNNFKMQPSL